MIQRLLVVLALLSASAVAQSFYTDCTGIAGTSLSGTVVCANLPQGVTNLYNPSLYTPMPHGFPAQGVAPTGGSCTVGNHCYLVGAGDPASLQAQLTAAASDCSSHGSWVVIPSANTYTSAAGSFLAGPTNCDATHWVIVQSRELSSLSAPGTRISASNANMPTLFSQSYLYAPLVLPDNPATPLAAAGGACTATGGGASTVPCGWWFAGLEIGQPVDLPHGPSNPDQIALVFAGDGCAIVGGGGCPFTSSHTILNIASRVVFDRCWIHGHSVNSNLRHGIRFTASYFAVEDSIVADMHSSQSQSTGISSDFTYGNIDVGNTEIEASGEGMLFGATDPVIPNLIMSDIYLHGSYVHKPQSWFLTWIANIDTRNWLECKQCQRFLIEGNTFDGDIGKSESAALQWTVRDSFGVCTWCRVTDIVIRYNHMSNMTDWISILSANGTSPGGSQGPDLPAKRFEVHDNVVENVNEFYPSTAPNLICTGGTSPCGNGRLIQFNDGDASSAGCSGTPNTAQCQMSDIVITHNTISGMDGIAQGVSAAFVFAGSPATGSKGYNIVVTNNVLTSGSFMQANDLGINHPVKSAWDAYFSTYTFDNNVLTGIVGAGYGFSDFPSPICNFSNSTGNGCAGGNPGWPAAMTNVGFANYNSGIGGDYHLCFNTAFAPCVTSSPYVSLASDGLQNTSEWNNINPGADIDAVANMTYCSTTGQCQMPALTNYGPFKGEQTENFYSVRMPGYSEARIGDGGGMNPTTHVALSGAGLFISGYGYRWWDLSHDPGKKMDVGGWDAGMMGVDILGGASGGNSACGTAGSTDQKGFYGTVVPLYANNVRIAYRFDWPVTSGSVGSLSVVPNLMSHGAFVTYRPGKVVERISWDNNCGSTVTWTQQPSLNNHWMSFVHYPAPHAPNLPLSEYPPAYPGAWDDSFFQGNTCGQSPATLTGVTVGASAVYSYSTLTSFTPGVNEVIFVDGFTNSGNNGEFVITAVDLVGKTITVAKTSQVNETHAGTATLWLGYATCTPSPWRYVNSTGTTNGAIMNGVVPGESCPGTQANCGGGMNFGYTPGSTTDFASGEVYHIAAEFLEVAGDHYPMGGNYRCIASVGCRTQMQNLATLNPTGTDAWVQHILGWFGSFGIANTTGESARQNEYETPPIPTMNTGSAPVFNYDRAEWGMAADATPKVDFTLTGTMYDPTFCVNGWNGSSPNVSINGTPQTENVNYVKVVSPGGGDPCGGLLLQIVNAANPNNQTSGDVALSNGTRVVITAGSFPSNGGGSQKGGVGSTGGVTKIGGNN